MQHISSAATSLNQIAAGLRRILPTLPAGITVLDFGGGRYNAGKDYAAQMGIRLEVFDPYNRSRAENEQALTTPADIITCNNVLNVLTDTALEPTIDALHQMNLPVFITVYEGDRGGIGHQTGPDQYQRNERLTDYIIRLESHFRSIERRGSVLFCQP